MEREITPNHNLTLWQIACSCACGAKWPHSYVTFSFGGTPSLIEQAELKPTNIIQSNHHYGHCFNCVKLADPLEELLTRYEAL